MLSDVTGLFESAVAGSAADRRLSRRLTDVWARTARGRFPSWELFQEADLSDDWDWMFVVDIERSAGFPYFIYLGEHLAKLSDVFLCGPRDWSATLLEKATEDIFSAVQDEGPYMREDNLTLCDGRSVLFRAVVLPLADDGETITHVVGAANGRFSHKSCSPKPALRAI